MAVNQTWVVYVESYSDEAAQDLVGVHIERTYPATDEGRELAFKFCREKASWVAAKRGGNYAEHSDSKELRTWVNNPKYAAAFKMVFVAKLVPHIRRAK